MKKLLIIAVGIIIAASATLFAAEQMDSLTRCGRDGAARRAVAGLRMLPPR